MDRRTYSIDIYAFPNRNKSGFSELLEWEQENLDKLRDEDRVEPLLIGGYNAVRVYRSYYEEENEFRLGRDVIIIPSKNYIYHIEMVWTDPSGNDSSNQARIEFEDLLESFVISQP